MYQHDARRTGRIPAGIGLQNRQVKVFLEGQENDYFYQPAIDEEGIIYFEARFKGREGLFAYYPNGKEKWFYQKQLESVMPVLTPENFIITFENGKIIAIDKNGNFKWQKSSDGVMFAPYLAITENGNLYAYSAGPGLTTKITAIDSQTGSDIWNYETEGYVGWGTRILSVNQGGVVYISYNDTLYAVNPDGTQKWKRVFTSKCTYHQTCIPQVGTPSIGDDGTIYIVAAYELDWRSMQDEGYFSCLHAINPENPEQENWEPKCGFITTQPPAISTQGNIFMAGARSGDWCSIGLLNIVSAGGEYLSGVDFGCGTVLYTIAVDPQGIIYSLCSGNFIKAFDSQGNQLWSVPLSSGRIEPSFGSQGNIYVGGWKRLYAISPGPAQTWNFNTTFEYNLDGDYDTVEGTGFLRGTANLTGSLLSAEGEVSFNGPLPQSIPEIYLISTNDVNEFLTSQTLTPNQFTYTEINPGTYAFTVSVPSPIIPINDGHYEIWVRFSGYDFFVNTSSAIYTNYLPIERAKPPVLLVHGFEYPLNPKDIFDSIIGTWSFNPVKDWAKMSEVLTGKDTEQQNEEQVKGASFWKLKRKIVDGFTVYISNYTLDKTSQSLADLRLYAQNLAMEIETIKSLENTDKVNIVAHSMGGLVARSYIESADLKGLPDAGNYPDLNYNHDVQKLIMLGTANHGASLARLGTVLFGIDCFVPLPPKDIYQCLEENKYFSFAQILPERFNPYLDKLNGGVTGNFLGVEYSTIAGDYYNIKTCDLLTSPVLALKGCRSIVSSDGIVSVGSVELDEIPHASDPCRADIVYLDHFALLSAEPSTKRVRNILLNASHEIPLDIRWPCPETLHFACPVDIIITDTLGRIIDSYGNNEIPSAAIEVLGEEKIFHLPPDLNYVVEINSFGSGNFTLVETSPSGPSSISTNVFNRIPISDQTNAVLVVEVNNPSRLMLIDYDGNGTPDEGKIPDVTETTTINQQPSYDCNDKIEFIGYELISQNRISRTEFEYSMRVRAANWGGQDIKNISLRLINVPANTTLIDDAVEFSLIEARKESLSDDTFTIRTDRSIEGLKSDIVWRVSGCSERSRSDFSHDWIVDLADLMQFAQAWLNEGPGMPEDLYPDSAIDFKDFSEFSEEWQK